MSQTRTHPTPVAAPLQVQRVEQQSIESIQGYAKLKEGLDHLNTIFGQRKSMSEDQFIDSINAANVALHVTGRVLLDHANETQKKEVIDLLVASNQRFVDEFTKERHFQLRTKDINTADYNDIVRKASRNYATAKNKDTTIENTLNKVLDKELEGSSVAVVGQAKGQDAAAAPASVAAPTASVAAVTEPITTVVAAVNAPIATTPVSVADDIPMPMQVSKKERHGFFGRAGVAILALGIAGGAVGFTVGNQTPASASTISSAHHHKQDRQKEADRFSNAIVLDNQANGEVQPTQRDVTYSQALHEAQLARRFAIKNIHSVGWGTAVVHYSTNLIVKIARQEKANAKVQNTTGAIYVITSPSSSDHKKIVHTSALIADEDRARMREIVHRDFIRGETLVNVSMGMPYNKTDEPIKNLYMDQAVAKDQYLLKLVRKEYRGDNKLIDEAANQLINAQRQKNATTVNEASYASSQ